MSIYKFRLDKSTGQIIRCEITDYKQTETLIKMSGYLATKYSTVATIPISKLDKYHCGSVFSFTDDIDKAYDIIHQHYQEEIDRKIKDLSTMKTTYFMMEKNHNREDSQC